MTLPVIVLGAGGHAKVLIDILFLRGRTLLGVTDRDTKKAGTTFQGVKILGTDDILTDFPPGSVELVNAIGAVSPMKSRRELFETYQSRGYRFASLIHPGAIVARQVQLGEGVQVMAGTIIQADSRVGDNCILNTGVSIDHDCKISNHVHLAPGVTLSGNVTIGEGSHLGTGATVIQNITIGPGRLVRAGSVITQDIA